MQRNYKMDNVKFILILLVVFGHFLELIGGDIGNYIYRIIYLFHMPAFMFITGYFARFNAKKIISTLIYPYVIFQILYLAFQTIIINGETNVTLQFTTPYWLLWYLLTIIFYYLLIPLFSNEDIQYQIGMTIGVIVISLCANFDTTIGYYMSLSRFFTFLPYFVLGYYFLSNHVFEKLEKKNRIYQYIKMCAILGVVSSFIYIGKAEFPNTVLYGSFSYEALRYTPFVKFILLVFGFCWIAFLMLAVPNVKIPVISSVGRNTFSIFLMHGFVVKLAGKYSLFRYSFWQNIVLAVMLSLMVVLVFGNSWTSRLFAKVFTGNWITEIIEKCKIDIVCKNKKKSGGSVN